MKTTEETQIHQFGEEIKEQIERWKAYKKGGCSDPFWPDGVNMNLVRNHVIFAKGQIKRACAESSMQIPEEFYLPTPPAIDDNYFAKPKSDRAKRIMSVPGWRCASPVQPEKNQKYNDYQMSLF